MVRTEGEPRDQWRICFTSAHADLETHRSNIFQKLNLHSGAELILYAIRKGVIT